MKYTQEEIKRIIEEIRDWIQRYPNSDYINVPTDNVLFFLDTIESQGERLRDYEDDYKSVMAERCDDERHCTCVPALKVKLKELLNA